jgi:hypothetical protein
MFRKSIVSLLAIMALAFAVFAVPAADAVRGPDYEAVSVVTPDVAASPAVQTSFQYLQVEAVYSAAEVDIGDIAAAVKTERRHAAVQRIFAPTFATYSVPIEHAGADTAFHRTRARSNGFTGLAANNYARASL